MAMALPVLNAAALTESGGDPVVTKYYFHGGKRVAMDREGVVQWLVGDHLGSTSLVLNANGTVHSEARHYPYGEERWSSGTLPTDYRFTGQRNESGLGLIHMGARFYDSYINRWISPDTIIPNLTNPQSFNRYSYVLGNPCRYRDPTGHCVWDGCILEIIAVGAGVGLIVDYSVQVKENMDRGLSFWDAVFHKNINEGEMVGAAASGAVMASTFVAAGPTTVGGYLVTGGVGGFFGGQTGRFVSAGWDESISFLQGQGWDNTRLLEQAAANGLLDRESMAIDTVSGVVAGGLGWVGEQLFHSTSSTVFSRRTSQIYLYRENEMFIDTGEYVLRLPPDRLRELLYALDNGLFELARGILAELAQVETSDLLESDGIEP